MHWYMHNSSLFNFQNEIPMRYYLRLNGNRIFVPQTLLDVGRISTYLFKGFITIKSLTEDLFCTGDIETLGYCMEVYRQFVSCEPLAFTKTA